MLAIVALCDCPCAPDPLAPCDWLEPLPTAPPVHVGAMLQPPSPTAVAAHLTARGWALESTPDGPTRSLCPICAQGRGGAR